MPKRISVKASLKVRLLIASDIAAEGLNLHFQCHRLVHFDLPWSLMTFQQRNGRIDRYGQTEQPLVVYLYTRCQEARIHNDHRILQLLSEKEEQAQQNIGDTSILLGTNNPEEQEEIVADRIQQTVEAVDWEQELDKKGSQSNSSEGYDAMAYLLDTASRRTMQEDEQSDRPQAEKDIPTIFESFFDYTAEALKLIDNRRDMRLRVHRSDRIIENGISKRVEGPYFGRAALDAAGSG